MIKNKDFNLYLFIIPLCLLGHIDVSFRNNENDPYCSLRGRRGSK